MIYVCIYSDFSGGYRFSLSDFVQQPGTGMRFLPDSAGLRLARIFTFENATLAAEFHNGVSRLPQRWVERLVVYGLPTPGGVYHPFKNLPAPLAAAS